MFGFVSKKKYLQLQGDLDVTEYLLNCEKANREDLSNRLDVAEGRLRQLGNTINKLSLLNTSELVEENEILRFQVEALNDILDELETHNNVDK